MAVLEYLMEATHLDELTVSDWALREGIVLDAIGARDPVELPATPGPCGAGRSSRSAAARTGASRTPARWPTSRSRSLTRQRAPRAGPGRARPARVRRPPPRHRRAHQPAGPRPAQRLPHRERRPAGLLAPGGPDPYDDGPLSRAGHPEAHLRALRPAEKHDRARAVALTAMLRLADGLDASHRGLVQAIRAEPLGPAASSRSCSPRAASPSSSCGRSGASRRFSSGPSASYAASVSRRHRVGSRRRRPGGDRASAEV